MWMKSERQTVSYIKELVWDSCLFGVFELYFDFRALMFGLHIRVGGRSTGTRDTDSCELP